MLHKRSCSVISGLFWKKKHTPVFFKTVNVSASFFTVVHCSPQYQQEELGHVLAVLQILSHAIPTNSVTEDHYFYFIDEKTGWGEGT